jgi:serine/threonine protein kinase
MHRARARTTATLYYDSVHLAWSCCCWLNNLRALTYTYLISLYLDCFIQVDIYSFGNIMYMLLQGRWPFDDFEIELEAAALVANGTRPMVDAALWHSADPVNQVLKQVMRMCHAQEPRERKTARQIETFLKDNMRKLDPGRLEEWGDA